MQYKAMSRIYIAFVIALFVGCEKVTYFPDKELVSISAKIAHKGGFSALFRENSLLACIAALDSNDGVEVDLQISKDRTLWLSHNSRLNTCDKTELCFPETSDETIQGFDSCQGRKVSFTSLESLLSYMATFHPKKHVLLDLKGWIPCGISGLDIEGLMRLEVEEIIRLGDKYGITESLHLETDVLSVLLWAKKKSSKVNTYLNVYGNAERGMLFSMNYGLTGMAFKLHAGGTISEDIIDLMHKKGKRVIIWNTTSNEEMKTYLSMRADFVEYDL